MLSYDVHLFDLDGTLTDTANTWIGIWRDGLADFGITGLSDEAIAANTHVWSAATNLGLSVHDVQAFTRGAYTRANERLPEAPLHDGVIPLLTDLRAADKKTGVFTTMDRELLEPFMANHQKLAELLDVIVAGTDVEHRKPHPAGIHFALGKLGVGKKEYNTVIYWGDKDTDIETAQNAGVASGLFYPPEHAGLYGEETIAALNPTHRIASWTEVSSGISIPKPS